MPDLVIRNLRASIDGAEILKGIDLDLSKGEVHAIMGPNGSGKSTLAHVLMGHPAYEVTAGEVAFKGEDVLDLEPDERSRLGMFLAFQYPSAIPGVTVANFLRMAVNAHRRSEDGEQDPIRIPEFRKLLQENMEMLKIDRSMTVAVPERRVLGRREEAGRDPADGDPAPGAGDHGRDRLGPRHRRPADRLRRREPPGRAGARRPRDHPLLSGCFGTSSPTWCTFWSTAASSAPVVRRWPTSSSATATPHMEWKRRRSSVAKTDLTPEEAQAVANGDVEIDFCRHGRSRPHLSRPGAKTALAPFVRP